MAKIKLGARPTSFKKIVKFPMLDGTEGSIECEFKYRTRKEFGQFLDAWKSAPADGDAAAAVPPAPKTLAEQMAIADSDNVDYMLQILDGWNLDVELNRENVTELADTLPAAVAAVINGYRQAIVEGRLGN